MENALLVGLSRQMVLMNELDVVANNIANVNTSGYKADNALFGEYLMPRASDQSFSGRDRRIDFVQDRATWIDMSAGSIEHTGNPLDVALEGNAFLTVQNAQGQTRYTRNGSLSINAQGQLVTMGGDQVIGSSGPITFQSSDNDIVISATGVISVRQGNGTADTPRGSLSLVTFDKPGRLQKDGAGTFTAPADMTAQPASPNTKVVQGAVEKSNVNGVTQMARMIEITRSYTDIATILQQQSEQRRNALAQLSQTPTSS
ncbi:MAG TPA: flagellar basal-body rod protein FlgF [Xanthobacteraceae bacterium]|jgi:flagellar basal-body rod protein FlgF|nr:flagellar basal-body rod protein FlgF [Xanthobacteraceae bacterium]